MNIYSSKDFHNPDTLCDFFQSQSTKKFGWEQYSKTNQCMWVATIITLPIFLSEILSSSWLLVRGENKDLLVFLCTIFYFTWQLILGKERNRTDLMSFLSRSIHILPRAGKAGEKNTGHLPLLRLPLSSLFHCLPENNRNRLQQSN